MSSWLRWSCKKNNPSAALHFFAKAVSMDQQARQFFNCRQTVNTMASRVFFEHLNDPATALKYYRKALGYTNRDPLLFQEDRFEISNIFGNMANAYVALSDWPAAFQYFEKAFGQLRPGADENTVLELPYRHSRSPAHLAGKIRRRAPPPGGPARWAARKTKAGTMPTTPG